MYTTLAGSTAQNELDKEEHDLAQKLKKLCYLNGKERYPKESGKIIHKLGLNYKKRAPDKLNLIRSAVLLNAAILRDPADNVKDVKNDLSELCSLILQEAKATNPSKDLVKISRKIKININDMRKHVLGKLESISCIPERCGSDELYELERKKCEDIENLQLEIASKYTSIMEKVASTCVSILGKPPCKYALAGMGSLARQEITPYSDFENVILLQEGVQHKKNYEDEILKYFRWFAVIFQVILINLGETIIPSVAISSLNNYTKNKSWFYDGITPSGISFDGLMPHACKTPLGRQEPTPAKMWITEFIKPVSEMVRYLEFEENLKNGYHIADILTKTCFVSGSKEVYKTFSKAVKTKKTQDKLRNREALLKQIEEDRKAFDLITNMKILPVKQVFNMKNVIYRSATIFITALASHHNINKQSCFLILRSLREKNIFNKETTHKLMYAVAIACEVRLRIYMKKKSQNNSVKHIPDPESKANEIIETVGKRSIIDYFTIVCKFQGTLPKLFGKIPPKYIEFKHNSSLLVQVYLALHLYYQCERECETLLKDISTTPHENETTSICFYALGICKLQSKDYGTALNYFSKDLDIRTTHNNCNAEIDRIYFGMGLCRRGLNQFDNALEYFEKAVVTYKTAAKKPLTLKEKSEETLTTYEYEIGLCFFEKDNYKDALTKLQSVLAFRKRNTLNETKDKRVDTCLQNVGQCYLCISKYQDALEHFEQELSIRRKRAKRNPNDKDVEECLTIIERCKRLLLQNEACDTLL